MKKHFAIFLLLASGLLALGFGFGGNVGNMFSFKSAALAPDPLASGSKIVLGNFDEYGNFNAVPFEAIDFMGSAWGKVNADISNPNGPLNLRNSGGEVNIQAAPGSAVTIFSGNGYEMPGGGDANAGSVQIIGGSGWIGGSVIIRSGWSAAAPSCVKLQQDTGNSVTITNSGIGINRDDPEYPLDVLGTTRATDFLGDGSALTGVLHDASVFQTNSANLTALAAVAGITTSITGTNGVTLWITNGIVCAISSPTPPTGTTLYVSGSDISDANGTYVQDTSVTPSSPVYGSVTALWVNAGTGSIIGQAGNYYVYLWGPAGTSGPSIYETYGSGTNIGDPQNADPVAASNNGWWLISGSGGASTMITVTY